MSTEEEPEDLEVLINKYITNNRTHFENLVNEDKDMKFMYTICDKYPNNEYTVYGMYRHVLDLNFDYYNNYKNREDTTPFFTRVEALQHAVAYTIRKNWYGE